MMTASELTTCRNLLDMLQDCNGEVADYWGRMLEHIDAQAEQIATLKAALVSEISDQYDSDETKSAKTKALDQLAQEYPDIFKEE